ncbi:Uncharacterised protein [Acinetobacter baumannii]|nr:hypothetical protein MWMV6_MWMV6_03688 [Acinetobacter baumannii]CAI4178651.1 hypothetical protein MWMV1_MWMV1_03744 [Acinetobacter baumannii]SSR35622.1 Uncharacterised protein [Acinetobacter baumannii]SSS40748.1 Uncharacterised protein [Acinetobacter baumannii]SSS41467.1 Uncharacterised protein [Acinetobacter baumannii]
MAELFAFLSIAIATPTPIRPNIPETGLAEALLESPTNIWLSFIK